MDSIDHLLGKIHQGDNLVELRKLPDNCIHACVTDPPYGLQFMGKHWDYDVPKVDIWREVMRVLRPGGYLLSFFGTRTYHRGVIAIEDAGFEIRDQIGWCYGSGFPKSHDISKAIDKQAGETRPDAIIGGHMGAAGRAHGNDSINAGGMEIEKNIPAVVGKGELTRGTHVSEAAKQWKGWGTALKPAWEPICVARKPISEGTVAANVLKWGTGAINIDGCRIGNETLTYGPMRQHLEKRPWSDAQAKGERQKPAPKTITGRWPANLIHDGSEEVVDGFPNTKPTKPHNGDGQPLDTRNQGWGFKRMPCALSDNGGSAARFFYTAKASKWDRNDGCDALEEKELTALGNYSGTPEHTPKQNIRSKNNHPTVKPTDLMQYLCRLVTPPNGIVLDPYSGSGSTGKAALLECFRFIGYEREAEYCKIANARITQIKGQLKLFS